jgi:Cu+-exporting ATPase
MNAAHPTETPAPAPLPTPPVELQISGMTCSNCARHATEALQSVPGVASAAVQLDAGRATVRWQPGALPAGESLVEALRQAGYEARCVEQKESKIEGPGAWSPLAGWKFNVVVGSLATLPLIVGEWFFQLGMERWFQWVALGLALPVQILCGARFYRGAWSQLRRGSSNMDTLVALGSSTAFGYSLWGLLAGWQTHLYFMESAAIITLISLGHWLEAQASAKAASSLHALLNLAPKTARRRNEHGAETEVPVAALQINDVVVLKPGDRVPVDGTVIEGNSAVDESMLTGESLPVDKVAGAKLYGGTINQNGRLLMRVRATGDATALAQIIAVVQRAQSSRAGIQKLGDRVSSVFVPIVVLVALATGLWWGLAYDRALSVGQGIAPFLWPVHFPATALAAAVIHAAAVLIVACPCAMGLATPAAIMAGTNAAARRGILIRDGAALEKSGRITAVLFDKTGTLTQGKLAVAAVADLRGEGGQTPALGELAAALAQPSNHPLSRAVAAAGGGRPGADSLSPSEGERESAALDDSALRLIPLKTMKNPLDHWREHRGFGVEAKLDGTSLRLGSLNWLREIGVDVATANQFVEHWSQQGATILGLASDQQLIGLLALRDTVKPHAELVVAQLARQGKATYLITGDHALTAAAIAQQAGISKEHVFAEIRPEQKAEIVKQLQQRGERVAFVGDGINDAPALEQADLGIAVSQASDVAREAADIILLTADIQAIPEALGLAQATLRTIKQNLFWAFFYNVASVPLAALGFLSPVLCAAAMGLSDVIVIGNALRLHRWKN